ncbi:DUF4861 family protein [Parasediminibacterium sp. JCM 36343]|uniref:DUF4861 family protein n=1 Tax=Parasediminibacterium sp. JCM 36343 TaxID=3374279 RepID=UPI00397A2C56
MKGIIKISIQIPVLPCKKGILLLLLAGMMGNVVFATQIIISNPASFKREKEIISIKKTTLGKVKKGLFPIVKKGNKQLATQIIDTDNDGKWDELLVEVSLSAHGADTLQLSWAAKEAVSKRYTNIRLSLRSDMDSPTPEIPYAIRKRGFVQNIAKPYYQIEGPGIENDKVAFRAFFDYRNSEDIYGKIVDTPILEKVGVGASWHKLQPWGMDIFHTGNSLGAGGLAVEENKQIYRLGDADTSTFQVLYKGALQAAFKLGFTNWDVAKGKKNGSETISMAKGNYYYKNDIALALASKQKLIAGIANFGIDKVVYKKHNALFSSISTYGPQAEGTNTQLGVAIMFPSADYVGNMTADTASVIPNTSYVAMKHSQKKAIYFFACWEKTDARFSAAEGFENYLAQTAERLANPIKIKIINSK